MNHVVPRRFRAVPVTTTALGLLVAYATSAAVLAGASAPAAAAGASASASAVATAAPATDIATTVESRVTRFRRPQPPSSFTEDGERFRRAERIDPALLALPARVLKSSPKGYVQVQTTAGPVWLDSMDVVLDPPPTLNAGCVRAVSTRSDLRVAGVSGAGEDC